MMLPARHKRRNRLHRGPKARMKRLTGRCWHRDTAKDLARIDTLLAAILADMGGLL